MFTIIGSGFGIYGYLPALLKVYGEGVILPLSYKDKLLARSELIQFSTWISWAETLEEALNESTGVVLATTPARQLTIASELLNRPNIKRLILEKPLAPSPRLATHLLNKLKSADIDYRISYTFLHSEWYSKVDWNTIEHRSNVLTLRWTFMAHHFLHHVQTWKRSHNDGGGVLRFYGIHIIAFLARLGYYGLRYSELDGRLEGEPERWRAMFVGDHLPDFAIEIDSFSENKEFSICRQDAETYHILLSLLDPFGSEKLYEGQDARLHVLTQLISSFDAPNTNVYHLYESINVLWSEIEQQTRFPNIQE